MVALAPLDELTQEEAQEIWIALNKEAYRLERWANDYYNVKAKTGRAPETGRKMWVLAIERDALRTFLTAFSLRCREEGLGLPSATKLREILWEKPKDC